MILNLNIHFQFQHCFPTSISLHIPVKDLKFSNNELDTGGYFEDRS